MPESVTVADCAVSGIPLESPGSDDVGAMFAFSEPYKEAVCEADGSTSACRLIFIQPVMVNNIAKTIIALQLKNSPP